MSNTLSHAERELDILVKSSTDPDNRPIIEEFIPEIKALVEKFANSGQSGGSAPYTAGALSSAIKKLCLQQPICPIMGIEEEWNNCSGSSFQNNRCSALFKDGKEGKPYYLDAIVFRGQNGSGFTGNSVKLYDGSTIGSRQLIKEFPFTPKTFYIDVIETEWADKEETVQKQGGGWWTSVVKDESQLKEVFEYYDKFVDNQKI
jgi:hypothetical protein